MNKALLFVMAFIAVTTFLNCSSIEENNDPIIGIWYNDNNVSNTNKVLLTTSKQEWIFNDAYLGRYHKYNNNKISFKTDYRWVEKDGIYTISYPGTDFSDDIVTMGNSNGSTILKDQDGNILAIKE